MAALRSPGRNTLERRLVMLDGSVQVAAVLKLTGQTLTMQGDVE